MRHLLACLLALLPVGGAAHAACSTRAHEGRTYAVCEVTRADDLRPAAHLHRLLQAIMGWAVPRWRHHPMKLGPDGRRLSKRDGATSLRALRQAGHGAAEVRAMAGFGRQSGAACLGP